MGRDKAFIEVGGREILHRVLEDALAEVGDILIVGGDLPAHGEALLRYGWVAGSKKNTFERYGRTARLLGDRLPGMGPLAGFEVGLDAARHPTAWALACDLPLVPAAVGRRMLDELDRLLASDAEDSESATKAEPVGDDRPAAVAPVLGTQPPPMCMVCERRAAAVASRCLDSGRLKVLDFLGELRLRSLSADRFQDLGDPERIFLNVNRPEDVERAETLV
jgi:molybdopterin-guanine dinucleotide biosynthesis protein A